MIALLMIFTLVHTSGEHLPTVQACGDKAYANLAKSVDLIKDVELADGEIILHALGAPEPTRASRIVGTTGFFDVSVYMTIFVTVDAKTKTVTIGFISRASGAMPDRVRACAERWRSKIVRVK